MLIDADSCKNYWKGWGFGGDYVKKKCSIK